MASPTGSDAYQALAHLLRTCTRYTGALQQRHYARAGLTCTLYEAMVMTYLLQNGITEQQALANYCNVDKAGITRILKTMETQQVIQRNRNRNDMRQKHVELTTNGRTLARKVQRCDQQALEQVLTALQEPQMMQLQSTITQMLNQAALALEQA